MRNFVVKCFLALNLGWWTLATPKLMLYTVLKRHIKHRLWQAVMKWWKKKKTQQEKGQNQKRAEPRENTGSLQWWYLTFHSAVTLETGHKIAQTHRCVLTYMLAQWHKRKCTSSRKGRLRRGVDLAVWHFKLSSCYSSEMSNYSARHIYQSQEEFPNSGQ